VAGDKVPVTGASGFVGSAVARALIGRMNLAGLAVEIVEGDMRDAAAVTRAMKGTRFLFHVVATIACGQDGGLADEGYGSVNPVRSGPISKVIPRTKRSRESRIGGGLR
jgi:uncharacterized protein YbjT (DUF2867 family)